MNGTGLVRAGMALTLGMLWTGHVAGTAHYSTRWQDNVSVDSSSVDDQQSASVPWQFACEVILDQDTVIATALFRIDTLSTHPVDDDPEPADGTDDPHPGDGPSEPVDGPPLASGVPDGWRLTFGDEFTGSGDLDTESPGRNWRFETMDDGLHRTGNTGIDAQGAPVPMWDSVRGKRWSAWYNKHNDSNAYRDNGRLIMGGLHSFEPDPTRPIDYVDDGVHTAYGKSKLYTAWIDTFARKWVGPGDRHVVDPASPARTFKYGYVETRVNFSGMFTPGFRLSMWLMPASTDAAGKQLVVDKAYDAHGDNGVEIDLFEYEWTDPDSTNRIHMAVLGGAAGNRGTSVDTGPLGIDLYRGYHTIGFLWEEDRMIWSIDGIEVKRIDDPALIPDVYSYLIVSREMNSGVKRSGIDNVAAGDMLEEWPYIPRDPGLYAKNIWQYRNRINTDHASIDYIRVWQP